MKSLWALVSLVWLVGCGSVAGAGGAASGGAPGQGGEAEGGAGDGAKGGAGAAGAGGAAPAGGGGEGPVGGGGEGGAANVEACANALRCIDATNYFCDEISGPDDGSFEAACEEVGGTIAAASCTDPDFSWFDACLHDCATPNEFSNIGALDAAACYQSGGTFVTKAR
jgi:hypothetical protein